MPEENWTGVLASCRDWPVENVSAGVTDGHETLAVIGDPERIYRLASISKVFTAWACLVAVEEGSVDLEDPVGPPGATLRHCLAHAAGYAFDGRDAIARVGSRRIYSNTGIEVAAEHVAARTGIPFSAYLDEAVLSPLGLVHTALRGSPAHGIHSSLTDVLAFAREMLVPTLIATETADAATRVQFPELSGAVPGFGHFDPNPWGLGMEVRGVKSPHWMGARTSRRTFGHFGGSGTMFWVDPDIGLSLVALSDRSFDEWAEIAKVRWAQLSDSVIAHGGAR